MIYEGFASVYDQLMTNTPYDAWYALLKDKINKYKLPGKLIVDLACGTGGMTNRLAKDAYQCLGLDLSEEMLLIAQEKAYNSNLKVQYIQQDMSQMELFKKYDAFISFCDGFNYITDGETLKSIFLKIHDYLKADGLLIFDVSSDYKLQHVLGGQVFTETSKEASYIWENYFDEKTQLLEFDLTLFSKEGQYYKRYDEVHMQRAYSITQLKTYMIEAGFELLEVVDTNTGGPVTDTSERWCFIGRKK